MDHVVQRAQGAGGGVAGGSIGSDNMMSTGDGGSSVVEVSIPGPKVGLVIGKGGDTIKQLQVRSYAEHLSLLSNHHFFAF